MSPKEEVYDAEISPLMRQVIAICKRAGISVHASFALDGDLACTTHVVPRLADVPDEDRVGFDAWLDRYEPRARLAVEGTSPLMITTRNAAGDVIAMEAVL